MAKEIESLLIKVRTDLSASLKKFDQLTNRMNRMGKTSRATARDNAVLTRSFRTLTASVGAYVSIQGALSAIRKADEWRTFAAQIRNGTKETGDFNDVLEATYGIAQQTGTALEATAKNFRGIQRGAAEIGASNAQVLAVTRAVQQLGVISGATAEAQKNALLQFSQAMAGGVLRAEEFNSIIENTPEIAGRIAKGMGLTVGQLRKMVVAGKVASADVFKSLLEQSAAINKEFAEAPRLIDQSFQRVGNSADRLFGVLSERFNVNESIGGFLDDIATQLDRITDILSNDASFDQLIAQTDAWTGFLDDALDAMNRIASGNQLSQAETDVAMLGRAFRDLPDAVKYFMVVGLSYVDRFVAGVELSWKTLVSSAQIAWEAIVGAVEAAMTAALLPVNIFIDAAKRKFASFARDVAGLLSSLPGLDKLGSGLESLAQRIEADATGSRDIATAIQDVVNKRQANIQAIKDEQAANRAAYAERIESAKAATREAEKDLNAKIRAREESLRGLQATWAQKDAQEGLAGSLDNVSTSLNRTSDGLEKTAGSARRAAGGMAKLREEVQKINDSLQLRLLRATGRGMDADLLELEREFTEMIQKARAAGDQQTADLAAEVFDLERMRLQVAEIERQYDSILQKMRTREEEIRLQKDVGLLTEQQAAEQVVSLHQATALEIDGIIERWQTLAETIGDPELLAKLDEVRLKHYELKNTISSVAKGIQDQLEQAFVEAFTAFFEGTRSAEDAFRQFAISILRYLAQIAAQRFAAQIFGGLGKVIAGFLFHTGGIAGSIGGPSRTVNPLLFANAPRYHTGGLAGLAPNEVPAILQKGEEILPANDPRHRNNISSPQNVRIINAFDSAVIGDYLNSSTGERVILNAIRNNPGALRQVLS